MRMHASLILICYNTYTNIKRRKQMSIQAVNHHIYETIVFVKELPYNLSSGADAEKIKQAILERFEIIPKRYRRKVFQALDTKSTRYDSIGHNLWHPYIRQIRNSGRGPLFQ
jgi:hypothetical protein